MWYQSGTEEITLHDQPAYKTRAVWEPRTIPKPIFVRTSVKKDSIVSAMAIVSNINLTGCDINVVPFDGEPLDGAYTLQWLAHEAGD